MVIDIILRFPRVRKPSLILQAWSPQHKARFWLNSDISEQSRNSKWAEFQLFSNEIWRVGERLCQLKQCLTQLDMPKWGLLIFLVYKSESPIIPGESACFSMPWLRSQEQNGAHCSQGSQSIKPSTLLSGIPSDGNWIHAQMFLLF